MKIKISLWIFGVLGIFSALVSMVGVFFFSFAGAPAYIYLPVILMVLIVFIASVIGLFSLKRLWRNIFIAVVLLSNLIFLWFGAIVGSEHKEAVEIVVGSLRFYTLDILEFIFLLAFIVYFFLPSTRKLFDNKGSRLSG